MVTDIREDVEGTCIQMDFVAGFDDKTWDEFHIFIDADLVSPHLMEDLANDFVLNDLCDKKAVNFTTLLRKIEIE